MTPTVATGCDSRAVRRPGSVQGRAHGGGGGDVAGGDDGLGDRGQQLDEPGELAVVEHGVGTEGEGVGAVLEVLPQRASRRGSAIRRR